MTHYFLGVDIGATKSHALLADETGQVVGFGLAGPGSYEVVDWEGLQAVLHKLALCPWQPERSSRYSDPFKNLAQLDDRASHHGIKLFLYLFSDNLSVEQVDYPVGKFGVV